MTSIVLAGGRSLRLGRNKHSLELGGERLMQRIIARLAPLSSEVIVVLAYGSEAPTLPARVVCDIYPYKGPLGGIYSGLVASRSSHNLIVACDMPFLNNDLLRYMSELSPGFDVVIPTIGDKMEPLHAIYSQNCLEPIERQLKQGRLKIADFLAAVRVRYVGRGEIDRFDPEHLSFFNINTKADMEWAKGLEDAYRGTSIGANPQLC